MIRSGSSVSTVSLESLLYEYVDIQVNSPLRGKASLDIYYRTQYFLIKPITGRGNS